MAVWCGEGAMRYYGFGMGETRPSAHLLRQAQVCIDEERHMGAVRRMYALRFPGISTQGMTLQQVRGLEGVRVREGYKVMGKRFGIKWEGRNYSKLDWDAADPLNMALSSANVCLYACATPHYFPGLFAGTGIHPHLQTNFLRLRYRGSAQNADLHPRLQ
jgi:CRISPR-associated protein Cas1